MAIFYNHIKGCGVGTTGASDSTTDIWTWIKWATISNNTAIGTSTAVDVLWLPDILIDVTNTMNETPKLNAGKIITSNATGQSINTNFLFKDNVYYNEGKGIGLGGTGNGITLALQKDNTTNLISNLCLSSYIKGKGYPIRYTGIRHEFLMGDVEIKKSLIVQENTTLSSNTQIKAGLYVGNKEYEPTIGVIKADSKCEALYFNAISDRRAKSNITPAEFSATDIIKQLPVYTFKYLNDSKLSVGLIAQEAAEHDLNGFNMVDNLDASGEFGDFMQMKESKLVYVLWKAVQELSAEVENLKTEIASLK